MDSTDKTDVSLFDGFNFTGTLRPGKVSPRRDVPKTIIRYKSIDDCLSVDYYFRPDYADKIDGEPEGEKFAKFQNKIEIKTPQEIETLRKVGKV
jgi:hypothetical protein